MMRACVRGAPALDHILSRITPYYASMVDDGTPDLISIKNICEPSCPGVAIRFSSQKGYHLVALRAIAARTALLVYGGVPMASADVENHHSRWTIDLDAHFAVDGFPYGADATLGKYPLTHSGHLANHLSRPNATVGRIVPKGLSTAHKRLSPRLTIIRAGSAGIAAGDEITISYGAMTKMHPHLDRFFASLHRDGYALSKGLVKTADILACVTSPFIYATRGLPVGPAKKDGEDSKRQMSRDDDSAWWNVELRGRLTAACNATLPMLMRATAGEKVFCVMHSIMSLPTEGYDASKGEWQRGDQGVEDAPGHQDEHEASMAGLRDEDMPLSVIVALQPNTRLRVRKHGVWITICMQPGDVLFFRGDLCHYGVGYASVNVRIHCHLYAPNFRPFQPVSIHACC